MTNASHIIDNIIYPISISCIVIALQSLFHVSPNDVNENKHLTTTFKYFVAALLLRLTPSQRMPLRKIKMRKICFDFFERCKTVLSLIIYVSEFAIYC